MEIMRKTFLRGMALTKVANELVSIDVDATSGNWKFIFGGQTSADIAFDATAAQVKTAIELLSTVAADDILVSGGPGKTGGGKPYYFAFASLANVGAITVGAGDTPLAGGGASTTVVVEEAGGNLRSIKYSHVPTANGRIQALQLAEFFNKRGDQIEVHPLFFTLDLASARCHININRGSTTPSVTDYDLIVSTGASAPDDLKTVDLSLGVLGVQNVSILFDTTFSELILPGVEWSLTAFDPSMHIYDT